MDQSLRGFGNAAPTIRGSIDSLETVAILVPIDGNEPENREPGISRFAINGMAQPVGSN
jgi:hypothetical protein